MRHEMRGLRCIMLALWLCGCGELDTVDHVKDLRMLAVRLDPPDQKLTPSQLQALPGAQATQTVNVTVLIADPNAAGRSIDYTLSTCARLDTTNRNCTSASIGYQQILQGQTSAPNGYTELSLTFSAPDTLLLQALEQDPYHGTQGLWLPVQLELSAGQQQVVGTKLVVYSLPDVAGDDVLNENPNLLAIHVDQDEWAAQTPFVFSVAATPKDGFVLNPIFDTSAQQRYQQPTFTGNTRASQEIWLVDYFSTWGGMTPTTAGGAGLAAANQNTQPSSAFKPPKAAQLGPGLFWFVVRDGRGGESWLVRPAVLTP
jgi:hypothetical protein